MYIKWDNRDWTVKKPCHQAKALGSLQDTLETSLFANQLFPTVDCPEESQVLPLPNAGLRHSRAVLKCLREGAGPQQIDTRHVLDRETSSSDVYAHDFGNWRFGEGSASCLQDNQAVGNS